MIQTLHLYHTRVEKYYLKLDSFVRDLPMDYTFCSGAESYTSQPSPSPPPQFDMLSENKKAKDSGKGVML